MHRKQLVGADRRADSTRLIAAVRKIGQEDPQGGVGSNRVFHNFLLGQNLSASH